MLHGFLIGSHRPAGFALPLLLELLGTLPFAVAPLAGVKVCAAGGAGVLLASDVAVVGADGVGGGHGVVGQLVVLGG